MAKEGALNLCSIKPVALGEGIDFKGHKEPSLHVGINKVCLPKPDNYEILLQAGKTKKLVGRDQG